MENRNWDQLEQHPEWESPYMSELGWEEEASTSQTESYFNVDNPLRETAVTINTEEDPNLGIWEINESTWENESRIDNEEWELQNFLEVEELKEEEGEGYLGKKCKCSDSKEEVDANATDNYLQEEFNYLQFEDDLGINEEEALPILYNEWHDEKEPVDEQGDFLFEPQLNDNPPKIPIKRFICTDTNKFDFQSTIEKANGLAVSWAENVIEGLRSSALTPETRRIFLKIFKVQPHSRYGNTRWRIGSLVRQRIKQSSRKLLRNGWIKIYCDDLVENESTIEVSIFKVVPRRYSLYLSTYFRQLIMNGKYEEIAAYLLMAALQIYYRRLNRGKTKLSSPQCYVQFILEFNRVHVPSIIAEGCNSVSAYRQPSITASRTQSGKKVQMGSGSQPRPSRPAIIMPNYSDMIRLFLRSEPLPSRFEPALRLALKEFKKFFEVKSSRDSKYERISCYLKKLEQGNVDDRYIPKIKICGTYFGKTHDQQRGRHSNVGCEPSVEQKLYQNIHSKTDIDRKGQQLRIISHLKVDLLFEFIKLKPLNIQNEDWVIKLLYAPHNQMHSAIRLLNYLQDGTGRGMIPVYYNAVRHWILDRFKDQNSIYQCYA